MARPHVFQCDTTLYHPSEGKRVFPAGETDPGAAWHDAPGGKPADQGTTKQAMRDLIAAQDQIDALGERLARNDNDLAEMAKARDEAALQVTDLEQRAIAAEQGQVAADERAAAYMRERDDARADFQRCGDQVRDANARVAELEPEAAKVAGLVDELNVANQKVADQAAEIEGLKAQVAKFDGDGDGKTGGSKPKAGDKA